MPADDLSLEYTKTGYYGLGDDIKLGLSLLYGIGPNAPRLITVDDAGRLLLGNSGQPIGAVALIDGAAFGANAALIAQVGDGTPTKQAMFINSQGVLFSGAGWDRARSASAAALAATSGLGVAQVSSPGMWSVVSTPAAGAQASASKAAGAAGVRHICAGILITHGAIAAPVATAGQWVLRDGATGAGAILAAGQVAIPAAVFQGTPFLLSGLAIPGSAATAMTLEFTAGLANLLEGCTLFGFDTV